PFREAVTGLISEGLLVASPGRGTVVNQVDRQQVVEFYAMRRALEGLAAKFATPFLSEDDLLYLEQLTSRSEQLNDHEKQEQINKVFHQTIHAAAHNRYLFSSLNAFQSTIILLKGTPYSIPGRPE